MRHIAVLALLFVATLVVTSAAQIPNVLSYQGVLKNADGMVVPDGDYDLTFRLYVSDTGGAAAFWTEAQTVAVAGGIFDVLLGSVVAFDASFHDAYWLGTSVEGEPELSPRTLLAAAPYSRCAAEVVDGAISTEALGNHVVTSVKIADGTIELADIGQNGALQAQVIKWNGQAWVIDDDYGTQGAISGVFGIDGLTGGGTSGVIQIGIANGGIQPDMIAPHSITTNQIASGAVEPYQIGNGSATDGLVLKWSAGQQSWMPDIDAEGIQSVVAGSGLTGGGQGGEVDLNVDFGGIGTLPTVSHSDHHHDDSYVNTGDENAITAGMVADGAIGGAELASQSVSTAKLGTGAVTAAKIALSAVTESRIASGAVTGNKLATAAVDSSKLADAAVTGPKLGTAAVATDKLEDAAVTGPKLGTAAVATDKLEDAAVTGSKLGTAAVATDKLEDAAVTGAKLGTAAVATDKLEDAAVTGAKLGPAAVTTDKLEDAAVTGAKIADQSVEFVDLAQGGALHGDVMKWSDARVGWKAAPDSVGIVDVIAGDGLTETGMGGSGIVTLSVDFAGTGSATTVPRSDHDHDANYVEEGQVDAISGAMILDGSVDSADIQDSAVTSAKIADATIGLADVAQNGAIEGQVMKWSEPGGSWVVADDESGSGGSTGWVDDGAVVRLETVSDSVGIGTSSPQARLDVVGALRTEAFEMPTGAGSGYVLMSDATGAGSWQVSPGGMGGSGVAEYVPVFTSPTTLGASVIHQSADGLIGIGTTTGTSTVTISGSASEAPVSILYSGTANPEHILSLERTNVPPPYSKMLVLREPSGLSIYSSFIQCRRGSDTEFSVDGDGSVHVNASTDRAGEFTTDCDTTHSTYAVYGEYTGTGDINARGVYGKSVPMDGWGYGGEFLGGDSGVVGRVDPTGSGTYRGVYGRVEGGSGRNYGVYGHAYGSTHTNYGVYGSAHDGTSYAGYFAGDTHVNGTLSKSAGSFRIDHPLDPANKYLSHSFVESPDMMNVYNGNVVLDSNGEAVVVLPEWFEALNRDFRYQLTCIGGFAPVYVSEELAGNRFSIAGGTPGLKVSWQLTGIRHDRFAEEHRIIVEEEKRPPERGKYLHPELYGQPEELTLHRAEPPE